MENVEPVDPALALVARKCSVAFPIAQLVAAPSLVVVVVVVVVAVVVATSELTVGRAGVTDFASIERFGSGPEALQMVLQSFHCLAVV